jgi:hypothetical protein
LWQNEKIWKGIDLEAEDEVFDISVGKEFYRKAEQCSKSNGA